MIDLEIVKELMKQLQDEMNYSGDDLNERLGKPKMEVTKIEGELPMDEDIPMQEMEDDMEFDFDADEGTFSEKTPEMELKKRLMALRGR